MQHRTKDARLSDRVYDKIKRVWARSIKGCSGAGGECCHRDDMHSQHAAIEWLLMYVKAPYG
jgi:hypothetical protein